jgi:hypothetical protein
MFDVEVAQFGDSSAPFDVNAAPAVTTAAEN